jgi:hypothetical protein
LFNLLLFQITVVQDGCKSFLECPKAEDLRVFMELQNDDSDEDEDEYDSEVNSDEEEAKEELKEL